MFKRIAAITLILIAAGALAACAAPAAQQTAPPPAPTITPTIAPPTAVPPTAEATAGPATVPAAQQVDMVTIYLIAIGDNGVSGPMVGCGDSAVAVNVPIVPTDQPLKPAIEALLAIKDQFYGESGLYDALYQSALTVDSASITGDTAAVALSGSLLQGGECDSPRIKAQLELTAAQFPGVTQAAITLNGQSLDDALSLK
jgi:hypothetical protein